MTLSKSSPPRARRIGPIGCALLSVPLSAAPLRAEPAGDALRLSVVIEGYEAKRGGRIGCGLYGSKEGWPMEAKKALAQVRPEPREGELVCTFTLPGPGRYAVAVGHDQNENGKVDTNLFGAPTEGWATTNDVTHAFRGPSFEESMVDVTGTTTVRVRMHY